MYAIIQTGGKQYKVSKGDNIQVELLPDDIDSKVNFDKVLMLNDAGSCRNRHTLSRERSSLRKSRTLREER